MHIDIYIYICMHIAQIYVGCGWLGGWCGRYIRGGGGWVIGVANAAE